MGGSAIRENDNYDSAKQDFLQIAEIILLITAGRNIDRRLPVGKKNYNSHCEKRYPGSEKAGHRRFGGS